MKNISLYFIVSISCIANIFCQNAVQLNTSLTEDTHVRAQLIELNPGFSSDIYLFTAEASEFSKYAPPTLYDENYIRTLTPRTEYTPSELETLIDNTEGNEPTNREINHIMDDFAYFDGLGRPKMEISYSSAPNSEHIVSFHEYDEIGRELKNYLHYNTTTLPIESNSLSIANAKAAQIAFYGNSAFGFETNDNNYAFAETVVEPSPLNRVEEQSAPGYAWRVQSNGNGATIKTRYKTNTTALNSYEADINNLTGITIITAGYAANALFITETEDEDGNVTREYTDKFGQVILKEADYYEGAVLKTLQTHYVYDDFGLLRCVIPPKAQGDPSLQDLCYYYNYDDRKRMVTKKLSGAQEVLMVYDNRDRLRITQDGVQRNGDQHKGEWLFTKYDGLNRPVITGILDQSESYYCDQDLYPVLENSNQCENWVKSTASNYRYLDNKINFGYDNNSFPNDYGVEVNTVTYYDHYEFLELSGVFNYPVSSYSYSTPSIGELSTEYSTFNFSSAESNLTKGLVTGAVVKNLEEDVYYLTVTYYDDKGRVIQIVAENHLGGIDRISTCYNFANEVLATIHEHTADADGNGSLESTIVQAERFTYDHRGRLLKQYHQIAGDSEVLLANNSYNELGQLETKELHYGLETNDYQYNIRGWLTQINDPDNMGSDKFALGLRYNNPETSSYINSGVNCVNYNGNISQMIWKHSGESSQKSYLFDYDELNRLSFAELFTKTTTTWNPSDYLYCEYSYDKNGNITYLNRRSKESSSLVDNLAYTYNTQSNQLKKVDDSADKTAGFLDGVTETTEYLYDANGNMYIDKNNGITNIEYNYLNLPSIVTKDGSSEYYDYNAAGAKLKHIAKNNDETDYCTNLVYENGSLKYLLSAEGRIVPGVGTYSYEYFLKDHLGNTRVTLASNGEVKQRNDYYPFGLRHEPINPEQSDQKYLYNGKELQEETGWLDYGARMYDAALGRFHVVDPLTDFMPGITPYNYAFNNPIGNTDEYGMWGDPKKKRERQLKRQNRKRTRQRRREIRKRNRSYGTVSHWGGTGDTPHVPNSRTPTAERDNDQLTPLDPITALIPNDYPEPELLIRPPSPPTPEYRGNPIPPNTNLTFNRNIKFNFRENTFYDLAATEKTLSDLVKTLKEYPQLQLIILGNLQRKGISAPSNDRKLLDSSDPIPFNGTKGWTPGGKMSSRAQAVYDYLVSKGIDSSRLKSWQGNLYPDHKRGQTTSFILKNP